MHPGHLLDLGGRPRIAVDLDLVEVGDHGLSDLVGGGRRELPKKESGG